MSNLTVRKQGAVAKADPNLAELQVITERMYREIVREGGSDTLLAMPPPELKERMIARGHELSGLLRPIATSTIDRDRAAQALGRFYGGYLNLKTDNPAMMLAGFVKKLEDYPALAIEAACDDFENHRVVDYVNEAGDNVYFTPDHAPSFPRLLIVVKEKTAAMQSEQAMMRRVLMVRHVRGAELEQDPKVGALLRDLANQLGAVHSEQLELDRAETKRKAQEARERSERIIREAAERRALAG